MRSIEIIDAYFTAALPLAAIACLVLGVAAGFLIVRAERKRDPWRRARRGDAP